ncbi:hypothetical protein E2C01_089217 [Portunus trituberculatus]|uniref:Uncharacterized protein n=1 Tax=Portunus trituberculatus TaxID=210409 RepID=A0A5B7JHJ2_PORTR|nr:hypothetical protein [Portunus trituberculatus]
MNSWGGQGAPHRALAPCRGRGGCAARPHPAKNKGRRSSFTGTFQGLGEQVRCGGESGLGQGTVRPAVGGGVAAGGTERGGEGPGEAGLWWIFCKPIFKCKCAWQHYQNRASGRLLMFPDTR